jgi:hypothetical protein
MSVIESRRVAPGFPLAAVVFVLSYLAARFGIEALPAGSPLRVAAALLPVLPFAWFLTVMVRGVRALDELQRRIHLEALAFAFTVFLLVMMTLGLLELAIQLPPQDLAYRHVWAMMPVLYFGGLWWARRRYGAS